MILRQDTHSLVPTTPLNHTQQTQHIQGCHRENTKKTVSPEGFQTTCRWTTLNHLLWKCPLTLSSIFLQLMIFALRYFRLLIP